MRLLSPPPFLRDGRGKPYPPPRSPRGSAAMIRPEDIRRKADNLYRGCLRAWLEGDESFFPRVVPARKEPDPDNLAAAVESIRRLREGSKQALGFGYTVEWQEVNSRKLGRNEFPARIL